MMIKRLGHRGLVWYLWVMANLTSQRDNMRRWLFAISLLAGNFWLIGVVYDLAFKKDLPLFLLSLSCCSITIITCATLFRLRPDFLKGIPDSNISGTRYYIASVVACYFLLIPVFGSLAFLLCWLFGDLRAHDSAIFVSLFAIWMPLWWSVPVGLGLGWYVHKQKASRSLRSRSH
jgi:hypothetical protein